MEERGETHQPKWFRKASPSSSLTNKAESRASSADTGRWEFTEEYWHKRDQREFQACDLNKLW